MPRRCRGIRGDVGIAPYGGEQGVRSQNVSPSVMACGHDTSLAEGGRGTRLRARGTDSHASDIGHWLGMTPLRGVRADRGVRTY